MLPNANDITYFEKNGIICTQNMSPLDVLVLTNYSVFASCQGERMGRKKTGVHYETRSGARPVEEWLEGMSPRVRTKLARSMDRVEKFWGLSGLPFVSQLRDDLFEITVEVDKKWPRVIFFCYERVIILSIFTDF